MHLLKRSGIPQAKVIFMSYGVEISMGTKRSGVIENFTIFSGNELLQRITFYIADERKGIPNFTLPNVDGYLSGMTKGKFKKYSLTIPYLLIYFRAPVRIAKKLERS